MSQIRKAIYQATCYMLIMVPFIYLGILPWWRAYNMELSTTSLTIIVISDLIGIALVFYGLRTKKNYIRDSGVVLLIIMTCLTYVAWLEEQPINRDRSNKYRLAEQIADYVLIQNAYEEARKQPFGQAEINNFVQIQIKDYNLKTQYKVTGYDVTINNANSASVTLTTTYPKLGMEKITGTLKKNVD